MPVTLHGARGRAGRGRVVRRAAGRASRPRSRTSCGRRSPGSWCCSTRPTCPGADVHGAPRAGARRGAQRGRADRRDPLPLRARERHARSSRSGGRTPCPVLEQVLEELEPSAARAGRRAQGRRRRRSSTCRSGRGCSRIVAENLPRTRSATPATARRSRSRSRASPDATRPHRRRRRDRRQRGRPAAPVRALLARGRRTRDPRHRPRARDRQARVVLAAGGTVEATGARGARPTDPLRLPGLGPTRGACDDE